MYRIDVCRHVPHACAAENEAAWIPLDQCGNSNPRLHAHSRRDAPEPSLGVRAAADG